MRNDHDARTQKTSATATPTPDEKRPAAEQGRQQDEQLGIETLEERVAPKMFF